MLFVCLSILEEFNPAVFVVVKLTIENNLSRTLSGGDARRQREHIAPPDGAVHHFDYEDRRDMLERHNIVGCTGTLLDGPDVTLDLGHVIITSNHMKMNM